MKKLLPASVMMVVALLVWSLWPSPPALVPAAPKSATTKTATRAPAKAVEPSAPTPDVRQELTPQEASVQWKAFLETTPVPEPLGADARGPHWLVPADHWKNVGRKSIGAAIQSQLWAAAHADTDYLRTTLVISEAAKPMMQQLLQDVPESIRNQYPTIEGLAAFLLASAPELRGYAMGNLHPEKAGPGEAVVNVATLEPGADRFRGDQLHRYLATEGGEWTRVIGAQETNRWRQLIQADKELSKMRLWSGVKPSPP